MRVKQLLIPGIAILSSALFLTGCANANDPISEPAPITEPTVNGGDQNNDGDAAASGSVTLVTTNSFAISDDAIAAFEAETGLTLNIVPVGSAGVLANMLVLTRDHPMGDAFFGVDNTFVSRILDADVSVGHVPTDLPEEASNWGGGRLTPITRGDVCLNIDLDWFAAHPDIQPPTGFIDLLRPDLAGQTVLLNPTTSSPGMAFLLATVAEFGDVELGSAQGSHSLPYGVPGDWQEYWRGLLANDALVVDSWSQGYFSDFSGAGEGGTRPIVVSYASSPASTLNADGTATTTAALLYTCFSQIEFAGILAGAANQHGAKQLIQFLGGEQFQSELPTQMWVYPVNPNVQLPAEWAQFTQQATQPLFLGTDIIENNRERFLEDWLQLALN